MIKTEVFFDSGTADFTFSLCRRRYIEIDGEKQYVGNPHHRVFAPGDIAGVEAFVQESLSQTGFAESPIIAEPFPPARERSVIEMISAEEHPIVTALNHIWNSQVVEAWKAKALEEAEIEEDEVRENVEGTDSQ